MAKKRNIKGNATEVELFTLLRKRYGEESTALFSQVRSGTGFSRAIRTADALAFGLWPSRGMEVEGFEFKRSRADWLRELKTPEKGEEIIQFCDRWWIVISDASIVQDGELPSTWGLLVSNGKKLQIKVEAPKLEAKPLSRSFVASVLRNAKEGMVDRGQIQAEIDESYDRGYESGESSRSFKQTWAEKDLATLKENVQEFEKASGIKIDNWNGKRIGEAVNFVLQYGPIEAVRRLRRVKDDLAHAVELIEAGIAEVEGDSKKSPE